MDFIDLKNIYKDKNYHKVVLLYESLKPSERTLDDELYYGLSISSLGNYKEAVNIFEKLSINHPTVTHYFNWSINLVLDRQVTKGIQVYTDMMQIHTEKGYELSDTYLKLYFTNSLIDVKETELAKKNLYELKSTMKYHQFADVHFSYMHGLPLFSDFMHAVKRFVSILNPEDAKTFIEDFSISIEKTHLKKLNNIYVNLTGQDIPEKSIPLQKKTVKKLSLAGTIILYIIISPIIILYGINIFYKKSKKCLLNIIQKDNHH